MAGGDRHASGRHAQRLGEVPRESAFAAAKLGKNTVGTKQLKKGAVSLAKINAAAKKSLRGATGATGATGAKGDRGEKGAAGEPGSALGFVEVDLFGKILNDSGENIVQSNISAGTEAGTVCFTGLPFAWKVVSVTRSGTQLSPGVAMYSRGANGGCAAGTELTVYNRVYNNGLHEFEASSNAMTVVFN